MTDQPVDPWGPLVEAEDGAAWRAWLAANHDRYPRGVWLVYFKPHADRSGVDYNTSVEEALCFGWVDSLLRKLDEDRYARKFTPRKAASNWSASNRKRVRKLIAQGRMTEIGMALVDQARAAGKWKDHRPPEISQEMPKELAVVLATDEGARAFYESLTEKQAGYFVVWINAAKRPDTRARRVAESLRLLSSGQKLGMK